MVVTRFRGVDTSTPFAVSSPFYTVAVDNISGTTIAAPTATTTTTARPSQSRAKFALVHALTRPFPPAPNTPEPTFIWGYGDPLFCGAVPMVQL